MPMDVKDRDELIAQYCDGYRAVVEVLLRISPEELDTPPGPGQWTVREIVHHLADSEMIAAVRLRWILAVDTPTIEGYDQAAFARRLHYDRDYQTSLELFKSVRASTAELLRLLTEEEWQRQARHTEAGAFGVERWLEIYAPHAHKHARQIRIARSLAVQAADQSS
jgi:DinB superfamily